MLVLIKKGSNRLEVRVAKYLMGYSAANKATSSFDASFSNFVKKWQKEHKLDADGEIGPLTWTAIAKCAADPAKDKAARCALQTVFDRVAVNGDWNTVTQNAVKAFKKACGMKEDTVVNAEVWHQLIARKAVKHQHTANFKQNDPKWAKLPYTITNNKKQTMESSACGPTSCASIVYSLKDKTIDPVKMAQFAIKVGARKKADGTDMQILSKAVAKEWKFSRVVETKANHIVKHCLDCGGYVSVAVGPGYFTSGGHHMPIWGYDQTYYYIDNPISKIKIKREITKVAAETNMYFCFYP